MAASRNCVLETPATVWNSVAWRSPWVIVPVLSSSRMSMSPAISTALPDLAMTFASSARFMPAMPIAGNRPPMVVGIRQTSSATRVTTEILAPTKAAIYGSATTTTRKASVIADSSTVRASSFGVFRREAPSTRAIMRSRKLWPGSLEIRTTISSVSTLVPPITPERSVPASRSTGADSPVTAASLMLAMPLMISPSAGIISPAATLTRSSLRRSEAGMRSSTTPCMRRAVSSARAARRLAAWPRPRASAMASAKLANSTVANRIAATARLKPNDGADGPPAIASQRVTTVPISTTNITGLRAATIGCSLAKAAIVACRSWRASVAARCTLVP